MVYLKSLNLGNWEAYEKRLSKDFNVYENKLQLVTTQTSPHSPVFLTNFVTRHQLQVKYSPLHGGCIPPLGTTAY